MPCGCTWTASLPTTRTRSSSPGVKGSHLRASTFGPAVKWRKVVAELGLPGFHFHDLRHTGNTLAASAGASTRELMRRFGQSTTRAALINQHATDERDREIAAAIDQRVARHRSAEPGRDGTERGNAAGNGTGMARDRHS
jgi:integrase